ANIVAVKAGNEENEKVQVLINALKSEEVKSYIESTYAGAVVPVF
ncbi:MAG: metal ABC transporter substrate-binding protein, partial [Agathobacter sp.]|nr:metal ABC transporter substrate-binding protein [Agathobacter sp.]